jgi:hypothetical protein
MLDKEGNLYASFEIKEAIERRLNQIVDIKPMDEAPPEVVPVSGNTALLLVNVVPAIRKLFAKERHNGFTENEAWIKLGYKLGS